MAENKKIPTIVVRIYVPGAGLEPARANAHKILSLACLPISPSRQLSQKRVLLFSTL